MDDEHGPAAGCNYNQCGVPQDAVNCPFTKDSQRATPVRADDSRSHWELFVPEPRAARQHRHRHDIPVEWFIADGRHAVRKLRCVCGDEIDRNVY